MGMWTFCRLCACVFFKAHLITFCVSLMEVREHLRSLSEQRSFDAYVLGFHVTGYLRG